jgi:hypothetical protein
MELFQPYAYIQFLQDGDFTENLLIIESVMG